MADTGVSPYTLGLLKHFEGYTAQPKWDNKQYSVGYSTRWEPGTPIGTRADHEAALAREAGEANNWLNQNISTPLTDQQRASLISFGYNTGVGSLDKLKGDINRGDWDTVGRRMLSFSRAGDDPEALLPRREDEVGLLLNGRDPTSGDTSASPVASATKQEKEPMSIFTLLGQAGLGMGGMGGQGTAIPALTSAADPSITGGMQNLFGSLAAFGGGDPASGSKNGAGDMKLANDAAAAAASGGNDTMTAQRRPFDMAQLASMLQKSGMLGATPRLAKAPTT